MKDAKFLEKLDKAGGKHEPKQKGKWRLIYHGTTLCCLINADCETSYPKVDKASGDPYIIEHSNTEKQGLKRIKELGLKSD